jgi:hypothetical protein
MGEEVASFALCNPSDYPFNLKLEIKRTNRDEGGIAHEAPQAASA